MGNSKKWAHLFEQVIGRQPSKEEFLAGKASGFDPKKIKEIANKHLETQTSPAGLSQTTSPTPPVRKPRTKKQKLVLGLALATLLLGLGLNYAYKKAEKEGPTLAVERFSQAIKSEDDSQLAKLLSTKEMKWTKEEAKLFRYNLGLNGDSLDTELKKIASSKGKKSYTNGMGNRILGMAVSKKNLGIFPEYQVITYPVEVFAKSNLSGLSVNGTALEKDKEVFITKIKPIAGETYKVSGKTDLGEIDTTVRAMGFPYKNKQILDVSSRNYNLTVELPSDLPEVENIKLYLNGKEVSDKLSTEVEILNGQEVKAYATFTYDGQNYKTKEESGYTYHTGQIILPELGLSDGDKNKILAAKKAKETEETAKAEAKKAEEAAKEAEEAANKAQAAATRPSVASAPTAGVSRWNATKDAQLAQFMVDWGNRMGQPGYQGNYGKNYVGGKLTYYWGNLNNLMDISFNSSTGVSDSEYTMVASYFYPIPNSSSKAHFYHFTIRRDGSPAVLYSENMLPPVIITKETENEELRNGFAAIVGS